MPIPLSQARAALARLDERHEEYYATLLDPFTHAITEQVVHAIASVTAYLRSALSFDAKGRVEFTVPNRQVLTTLDDEFEGTLKKLGYQRSIDTLVNQFPGQLPFLKDEFDILNSVLVTPLLEGPLLLGPDLDALAAQGQLVRGNLLDVAATAGDLAKRKILLSVNGLDIASMTRLLSRSLHLTIPEASTVAATSAAMFYRTAYSRVISRIEDGGTRDLRYTYDGPRDNLNRPFCRRLVDAARSGETWSRAEIERLDNGQIPSVWQSCGGFNCRHQWRIALEQ